MKKFIVVLLAAASITPIAAEQFFDVEWGEFCPRGYDHIKPNSFHFTGEGRYWARRREAFNKRLERCNTYTVSSRDACYDKLREVENKKSWAYQKEIREKKYFTYYVQ